MRTDYDYLKNEILVRFLNSEKSSPDFFQDIFQDYYKNDPETGLPSSEMEKFIFHWKLLEDRGYVQFQSGNGSPFSHSLDGNVTISNSPIRLTADGQEFAENLESSKKEWVEKIKGYGIGLASDALKTLATNYVTSSI